MNIMKNSTLSEVNVKKLKKILEGNPYAKFIRILKDYLSMDDVQQYISKNMKLDQQLYSLSMLNFLIRKIYNKLNYFVAKHMMHGQSGHKNLNNSCMVDEKCKYHYLPPYFYRRRKYRLIVQVRNAQIYNKWVIRYNQYLLSRYNYYINIEICSDVRWAFTQEAMWKTFKFNLNERYPTVINLHLYLLNQRRFGSCLQNNAHKVDSMCSKSKKARKYLYGEFLGYYKRDVIRHINTTNPIEGKIYYLMLLMNHVRSTKKKGLLESDLNINTIFEDFKRESKTSIQDEILIKIPLEDYEVELKLNSEQYKAFLKILDYIQKGKGVIFLIDESTEIGKIFLTTYSHFKIPIVANESSKCTMSKNMRSMNNLNLSEFLLKVRNNKKLTSTKNNIKIQKDMIINAIFLALNKNDYSTHYMTSRTILVAKNEHVYKLNDKLIFMFPREIIFFNNYDETIDDINNYYVDDFLNSLTQNSLSPHKTVSKRNCPIILLRYFDLSNELCNSKKSYAMISRIIKHIFKPRILLFSVENNVYPFQFKYK
ncbi:hypothetical protein Pfo_009095 [Paulownia fortunei]|nr:hypothetical protein Pfo_009095 [Paulownia fortunei]